MNKVRLRELFSSLQQVLEAKLIAVREVIAHPGAKGEAGEIDWRGMLASIPTRYQIAKAFVVDSDENVSDEIDIVIFDRQYSPLLFTHNNATYIAAESVYAVLEVKQALNREHLEYAAAKLASVRSLHRTSVPIVHAGGSYEPRELFRILGGILCLDSDWIPPFGDSLIRTLRDLPADGKVDLGCVLRHGAFDATYSVAGDINSLDVGAQATGLTFFFLRLLHRLQSLGTVPAADFRRYEQRL